MGLEHLDETFSAEVMGVAYIRLRSFSSLCSSADLYTKGIVEHTIWGSSLLSGVSGTSGPIRAGPRDVTDT